MEESKMVSQGEAVGALLRAEDELRKIVRRGNELLAAGREAKAAQEEASRARDDVVQVARDAALSLHGAHGALVQGAESVSAVSGEVAALVRSVRGAEAARVSDAKSLQDRVAGLERLVKVSLGVSVLLAVLLVLSLLR